MRDAYDAFKNEFSAGDHRIEGILDDVDPFQSLPHIDAVIRGVVTRLYCFEGEWAINLG